MTEDTKRALPLLVRYERAVERVKKAIEDFYEDIGATYIHHIKGRVKTPESIVEKMQREGIDDPLRLKDIAGVRVVCHNEMDVNQVATFIQRNFKPLEDKLHNGSEDGYRARHLIVEVRVWVIGHAINVPVEVQIRTVAEDLFATLSHRDVYKKTKPLPPGWEEKFKKLEGLLKRVDELGQEMREMLLSEEVAKNKDSTLNAGAVKIIVKDMLMRQIDDKEALQILSNCLFWKIKCVKDLEALLKDKKAYEVLNNLYKEMLAREVDPVGLISWGGILKAFGPEKGLPLIKNGIEVSWEFRQKKMHELDSRLRKQADDPEIREIARQIRQSDEEKSK